MSKIVNLNQARKAKAREDRRRAGDVNAAKFGRSKAERGLHKTLVEKANRALDGHQKEGVDRSEAGPAGPETE